MFIPNAIFYFSSAKNFSINHIDRNTRHRRCLPSNVHMNTIAILKKRRIYFFFIRWFRTEKKNASEWSRMNLFAREHDARNERVKTILFW